MLSKKVHTESYTRKNLVSLSFSEIRTKQGVRQSFSFPRYHLCWGTFETDETFFRGKPPPPDATFGWTYCYDHDQHQCGAFRLSQLLGLSCLVVSSSSCPPTPGLVCAGVEQGRPLLVVEQPLPLLLGLLHRPEQEDVQDHQGDARDQVDEEDAKPGIDFKKTLLI